MKNKKNGFAITALLYGLSIMALMTVVLMMSIMQNSRKNNTTTVKSVEQELNNYGATTTTYTDGSPSTVIPTGQSGYYKIELCNNSKVLTTGTVYIPENTKIDTTIGPTSTVTIGNVQVMTAGSTSYVNGMARYATTDADVKEYPFLNGQVITGSGCSKGFKMSKVSTDAPVISSTSIFTEKISTIVTQKKADIYAISYDASNPKGKPKRFAVTNNTTLNISGGEYLSDIYINYKEDLTKTTTSIKINNKEISANSQSINFSKTGYSFSRFGPMSNAPIQNGNYAISIAGASRSQNNTLTTSAYTPPAEPTVCQKANAIASDASDNRLVKYGSESIARPVVVKPYNSINGQKWRFDYLGGGAPYQYKITEIEEYKPFQVHKLDDSVASDQLPSTGSLGPMLICGTYKCIDPPSGSGNFESTDGYRDNPNQKWRLTASGLGTYIFETNYDKTHREYLKCEGSGESTRCYVTLSTTDATQFYIYNVNL